MPINWRAVFNRLWPMLDAPGDNYFGGPRFIRTVQDFAPDLPDYRELLDQRRAEEKSTSRRDYFYDILMDLPETHRVRVVNSILAIVGNSNPTVSAEIRGMVLGGAAVPTPVLPMETWNAQRLTDSLALIDAAVAARDYGRAVTLSYTCLEGFFKAFHRAKNPTVAPPNDITDLARWIRTHLRATFDGYPDEVFAQITNAAHVIDRVRNRFSEAHFDNEAAEWLAVYARDLTNTKIRLMLHFM